MSDLMRGFPPAEQNRVSLANWRKAPYCHWAFHHVREIIPTAEIPNNPKDVWELEAGVMDISCLGLEKIMADTDSDAVVILHDNKLVHETYRNGMTANDPHILMSVSKSMLGLVAGTLVERGELAIDNLITKFVPELSDTAYAGASVRDLLDMRAGVLFDEDYLATEGPIVDYRYAANWNPIHQYLGDSRQRPRHFPGFSRRNSSSRRNRRRRVRLSAPLLVQRHPDPW